MAEYPITQELMVERRAYDAALQQAELASRLEAECQELRQRIAQLEEAKREQARSKSGGRAMTHTPGPWKVYNASDLIRKPGSVAAERIGTPINTVVECNGYDLVMTEGDAHLIAAAPDLLAACEAALEAIRSDADVDWMLNVESQCCAAIAKARGGGG